MLSLVADGSFKLEPPDHQHWVMGHNYEQKYGSVRPPMARYLTGVQAKDWEPAMLLWPHWILSVDVCPKRSTKIISA